MPKEKAGMARLFAALLLLAAIAAGGLALYFKSSEGAADAALPAVANGDVQDPAALLKSLNEHLAKQPRDARAWAILARLQFEAERFPEAAQAYEKALALPTKVANDPALWCEYADALGMTQGGTLSGKPLELVRRALAISPHHPKALEMAGSAAYEQGDYAGALNYWRPLLAALEPGSKMHAELVAAIGRAERRAKVTIPVSSQ